MEDKLNFMYFLKPIIKMFMFEKVLPPILATGIPTVVTKKLLIFSVPKKTPCIKIVDSLSIAFSAVIPIEVSPRMQI